MSYDRLAGIYHLLEACTFGKVLQKARCAPLQEDAPQHVLILGDGNGRFLEKALQSWPNAFFVSVERSEGMLRQARKRVDSHRVRFVKADVTEGLSHLDHGSFDAVVTHFFLDCFLEDTLKHLIPEVLSKLKHKGCWYISDFTGRQWWQRLSLWIMYGFFHRLTETEADRLSDFQAILMRQSTYPTPLGSWMGGFVIAEKWRALPRQCQAHRLSP